ncbi:hypothetical protein chiPu_0013582 [Chiloscyllium punctatum]|uniref:Large ribosomal subunit protein uL24m n=1 Tax=Chiloscyllium punctatum TaxID=137246 RepID=A0A401SXJ0_CHIPU|nr:hypothetical protein [Chiloscyllium punctatum]
MPPPTQVRPHAQSPRLAPGRIHSAATTRGGKKRDTVISLILPHPSHPRSRRTMRLGSVLAAAARLPRGYRYGMSRPWTVTAQKMNPPGRQRRKVFVEPLAQDEWKIFRGDTVEILKGKDAGKQGKVNQVIRARNWVVLEGLNTHYRYVGKSGDHWGTYIASEAPLLLHDVALVDPSDRKPTTVDWRYTEEGEKVRVSTRSGRIIPKPVFQRRDGIVPEQWKGKSFSTPPQPMSPSCSTQPHTLPNPHRSLILHITRFKPSPPCLQSD